MSPRDAGAYGRAWAEIYDDLFESRDDPAVVSDVLLELAGDGRVLEFGVGTGRMALPLAARGVEVHGVDSSPAMLERLRQKPGGNHVQTTLGDITDVCVSGSFSVVVIGFSTIFLLGSQDRQISCFANAAKHVERGGLVVVEAFVPDHSRWTRGQQVSVARMDDDIVELHVGVHDAAIQQITTQHVVLSRSGVDFRPNHLRYAWPSELDLMARLAGLRLKERWSTWGRDPYTAESGSHISVYEKLTPAAAVGQERTQ